MTSKAGKWLKINEIENGLVDSPNADLVAQLARGSQLSGQKLGLSLGRQNKKMLKSRGESQDVVENKGLKKWGCTETRDVIENKGVTRLTRDVNENKGLNIKSGVNCAPKCTEKRTISTASIADLVAGRPVGHGLIDGIQNPVPPAGS